MNALRLSILAFSVPRVPFLSGRVADIHLFQGSVYGVTATCFLNLDVKTAEVELTGIPIGGVLRGTGRLDNSKTNSGAVILDDVFAATLARKFVKVKNAIYLKTSNIVIVTVQVPIFGTLEITLKQID